MSVKEFVTAYGDSAFQRREEVVRCRDCRFCGRGMWGVETFPVCRRRHTFQVSYDGFCAWASRKESE